MKFNFLQPVSTPRGHGHFIGAMADGVNCQIAMWDGNTPVNRIMSLDTVTEAKEPIKARKRKVEDETVSQVVDEP